MKKGKSETVEPQYQEIFEVEKKVGISSLGLMLNHVWQKDPKRLAFVLSRYKFVAKMLEGSSSVLEVGCGDGWASRIVRQSVGRLTISDFDPVFIDLYQKQESSLWPIEAMTHNMLEKPTETTYDAIYAIDVFEHISPTKEIDFLRNISSSLVDKGVLILGIPSLESQEYASEVSRLGHVNCKSGAEFRVLVGKFFHNVFLFSMNDEVVHTGFAKMANYLFVVCCAPKEVN
jgi:cyclopropane fatty-acyl-phospholipid synthase-like methyltransferase